MDFSAALSDRSTTDNFISDDDPKQARAKTQTKKEVIVNQKSKISQTSQDGKFYWYYPYMINMKPKERFIEYSDSDDDVSSESSIDQEESLALEEYLQEVYFNTYQMYEAEAKQRKHVVDIFNFNPDSLWQNIYL